MGGGGGCKSDSDTAKDSDGTPAANKDTGNDSDAGAPCSVAAGGLRPVPSAGNDSDASALTALPAVSVPIALAGGVARYTGNDSDARPLPVCVCACVCARARKLRVCACACVCVCVYVCDLSPPPPLSTFSSLLLVRGFGERGSPG